MDQMLITHKFTLKSINARDMEELFLVAHMWQLQHISQTHDFLLITDMYMSTLLYHGFPLSRFRIGRCVYLLPSSYIQFRSRLRP